MGPEVREEAQVSVQTALLAGEEGHPHMLHLQPWWEAHCSRLPGWHHPDLGQKPQCKSSNTHNPPQCAIGCKHRMSVLLWPWVIWSQGRQARVQQVTDQHWPDFKMPAFKMHLSKLWVDDNIIKQLVWPVLTLLLSYQVHGSELGSLWFISNSCNQQSIAMLEALWGFTAVLELNANINIPVAWPKIADYVTELTDVFWSSWVI